MADAWHAREGQYPINDLAQPLTQTQPVKPYPYNYFRTDELNPYPHNDFQPDIMQRTMVRPYPYNYWRCDESNDGYPYTELQPSVVRVVPPPPPPPEPENEPENIIQYDIYCDDKLMHSSIVPDNAWHVIDPVLNLQDSAAGSLEYTLPSFNAMYGKVQMMMSTISVRCNGKEIWEGRPVSFKEDMWLNHPIVCEGELAYLNDIYQIQAKYENVTLTSLIMQVIAVYNERAAENRKFVVSYVEEDPKYMSDLLTVDIPFQPTLETINNICKTYGLHVYMDNIWEDGVKTRRIKFTNDNGLGENVTQKIEFGINLVEYAKSYNFSELVTYVLPLGAKSNKAGTIVKDNDETANLVAAGFEQGTIISTGDDYSDTRIRNAMYLTVPSGADSMKISATSSALPESATIQSAVVLYNSDKSEIVHDFGWKDADESVEVGSYPTGKFYRVVLRYSNNDNILPSEITEATAEISKTRKGIPYGTTDHGRRYVIWPKDGYDSRGSSSEEYYHNAGDLVFIADGMDEYGSTPEEKNRYFVNEYEINADNATVFITTQMHLGAGMVVVYNQGQKYFLKKSATTDTMTAWSGLKFNGWYEKFEGTVKMYVACYDSASYEGETSGLTVVNSKVVDEGLEDYVTVDGIADNPNIVDTYFVHDTDASQYEGSILPESTYGRIERKMEWPDAKDGWTLYQNAISYLRSGQFDGLQIDLTAIDMGMLGVKAQLLKVGEMVRCVCGPYGLDKIMPVTAIKIPLDKPEDTVHTVGSKRKQSLTAVNNATNSEIFSMIAEKPSVSAVLSAAKSSAAEYLMDTQNGYVTTRYGENGHPEAIIVSDTEDYKLSPNGYWLIGKHGIGHIDNTSSQSEEAQAIANVAMMSNGDIVADRITTGTMSASRIFGDILKLGLLGTGNGSLAVYNGNEDAIIARIDANGIMQQQTPSEVNRYSRIDMHDGKLEFTRVNSQASPIFIKGDGIIDEHEDEATIEIYAGDSNRPNSSSILGIAVGNVAVWIDSEDAYGFGKTETINVRNNRYSFTKGLLTGVSSDGESLPNDSFTIGNKTYTFRDGLLVEVTQNE